MYSQFELLPSSVNEELKQFLWRAALCQLSPGVRVVEDDNGRPKHMKSEVAFHTLRRSTQEVLTSEAQKFDTKVKEAEMFLLAHKDASTKCQKATQSMFVKEHINTIERNVVAKLQEVMDGLPTPDGVEKMQVFFTNLQEIQQVLQLVPDDARSTCGLTNAAGSVNTKAFAQDVQSRVRREVQSSFGVVMTKTVKSVDARDWTRLHENLVLSEKYLSGCEKYPELLQLLFNDVRHEQVENGMVELRKQLVHTALGTFDTNMFFSTANISATPRCVDDEDLCLLFGRNPVASGNSAWLSFKVAHPISKELLSSKVRISIPHGHPRMREHARCAIFRTKSVSCEGNCSKSAPAKASPSPLVAAQQFLRSWASVFGVCVTPIICVRVTTKIFCLCSGTFT